jgi:hypothetical protein
MVVFCLIILSGMRHQIQASGPVAGQEVNTTLDPEIARYYLEECLTGTGGRGCTDRAIHEALALADSLPLSNELLQDLTKKFSPDFATLHFVERVHRDPRNRRLQEAFRTQLAFLRAKVTQRS